MKFIRSTRMNMAWPKRAARWLIPFAAAAGLALSASAFAQDKTKDAELTRDLVPAQRSLFTTIASLWKGDPDRINVRLWTSRGRLYHFGENIKVTIETDKDAYVVLMDQGASGRRHYLVPNKWHRTALRLKAGKSESIPADNSGWSIDVGGPRGVEMIYAFASSKPPSKAYLNRLLREMRSDQQFPEEARPIRAEFRDLFVKRGKVARGTANLQVYVMP